MLKHQRESVNGVKKEGMSNQITNNNEMVKMYINFFILKFILKMIISKKKKEKSTNKPQELNLTKFKIY